MRIYLITLLTLFHINTLAKDELLVQYCDDLGGKVVNSYRCPKSKLKIPFQFCTYTNQFGEHQFFDGCTGPSGGHSELFYPHCIRHDLCYHHEPSTSGKTQKMCDSEFKRGLLNSCQNAENPKKCRSWAKTMYKAVRSFGRLAYNCADYQGHY
ncbi:prokaryotic phospholipase A2 [Bacteriovorax sp. DB6_IX]|uniref:prokaryotic phospholipase A2 n=1 Tax=Bacteriovorax sp. DB6_IX TaxID=1353530 RepID=UPI00038A0DC6|nr:prokaryotic phospholipase A2 [Bacteriovorax sp. DB6_IX]EQC50992.1 prokaryotic phospholipase A2 [Bacteriovorax sp. DB6_IX]